MAKLKNAEIATLSRILGLAEGNVFDFTNKQLEQFCSDNGIDINEPALSKNGNSKGKRFREFILTRRSDVVARLLKSLAVYALDSGKIVDASAIEIMTIAERIHSPKSKNEFKSLDNPFSDEEFKLIEKQVWVAVADETPESVIDRLHTYLIRLLRRSLEDRNASLSNKGNGVLQYYAEKYIALVKKEGEVKSLIANAILDADGEIFRGLNAARNKNSLAHDNELIVEREARLALSWSLALIRFIIDIERDRVLRSDPSTH